MRLRFLIIVLTVELLCLTTNRVYPFNNEKIETTQELLKITSGLERIKLLQELSVLFQDSIPEISIRYANEAIDISQSNQALRASGLYFLGNLYRHLHEYSLALEYHHQALELRQNLSDQHSTAASLNNIGEIHKILNNKNEALKSFQEALSIRHILGNQNEIAYTLNNIGNVYWLDQNFEKALEYYLNALEIRTHIGNKLAISSSLNNLGNVYKTLKKYNKALNYYIKALEIRQALNNKELAAYSLNDIGGIYWRLQNYNKALENYNQSLKLRQQLGQKRYIASTHKNIGIVYKDLNELANSLNHYNKALGLYSELNDIKEQAVTYSYIGNLYRSDNNFDKSQEYYKIALNLHQSISNKRGIAYNSNNIGEILLKHKGGKEAEPYLIMAFENSNKTDDPFLSKKISENLFEYFSNRKNYKKALKYYRQFSKSQYDSIIAQHHKDRIAEFEAQYQISKNQDEISNLKKFNRQKTVLIYLFVAVFILALIIGYVTYKNIRIRKATNKALAQKNQKLEDMNSRLKESELILRDLNITKDKFFNIISRDLKSPFQELNNVSSSLYDNFDKLTPQENKKLTKTLHNLSIHTNTLVENLLLWAASQTGKTKFTPSSFNIKSTITQAIDKLKDPIIDKNLEISLNLTQQITCYADALTIGEVFRNLLTNAVKFSYPEGKITISTREKKYMIEIEISDHGIGISEDNLNKLFRLDSDYLALGTAQEKGSGIGLLLCKEYVEKNGGKIWAESQEGKGSRFFFTLPKNSKLSKLSNGVNSVLAQNITNTIT